MQTWQKIIFVLIIIIIIILLILLMKSLISTKKEGYIAKTEEHTDPITGYVDSWIKSVKNLYSTKSEKFAQSRTLRDFDALTPLNKDSIVTGKYKN